jgi:hypothetical protein
MPNAAEAIEKDERRALRDSYRAAGGSEKRPLHSFRTKAEKRKARDDHAERLRAMVGWMEEDPEKAAPLILKAIRLHPDATPTNAALIAYQMPGKMAGTFQEWKRWGGTIPKGATAAGYITKGPGFYPWPVFTAEQVNAPPMLEAEKAEPLLSLVEGEAEAIRAAVVAEDRKPKRSVEAVVELLSKTPDAKREVLTVEESAEEVAIPF